MLEHIDTLLLSLVAIATAISVWYAILQFNALRKGRLEDFERTFSIRKIVISEYRADNPHKHIICIELTNKNSAKPLAVDRVVLRFKNGEEVTAHIYKEIQQAFYLAPKKWGELEVTITDEKVKLLQGKEAVLTVYDTDEKPVSERITLKQDTYFFPSKRK